jgi:predicted dienelactone hydrolase
MTMNRPRRSLATLFAAGLCLAAAPGHAQTLDVVGTTTLPITDAARGRAITSEFWYPARPGTHAAPFAVLPAFEPIAIAQGAEPASNQPKRPLIVVSHGNWGTRFSQGSAARSLVLAGYVVLSVSHPGTMNGDITVTGRARLWERARDVTVALDHVLADTRWRGLIDDQRIGFLGHSFGGFAGVSLAGGIWTAARQEAVCAAQAPKDQYCAGFAETQDPAISRDGMGQSVRDDRIKAFYIMASGPAGGFSPESLAAIRTPFLVDSASIDTILAAPINSTAFAKAIPGAREVMRDVGHFTYVPECRPGAGATAAALICTDPPGVDRAATHRAVERDVIAFFRGML